MDAEKLTIKQTATGYWVLQRGTVAVAGAMTREAVERELELRRRLSACTLRRAGSQQHAVPARA
jgi:hypothetical protein